VFGGSGGLGRRFIYDATGYHYDGTNPQHYKFTGKERDSESGLDMFGARYYGSSLGRFMTPDWAASPTGYIPSAIASGDFNGDGKLDVCGAKCVVLGQAGGAK